MKSYSLLDQSIDALGLGTWKMEPQIASQAVCDAISIGYRHIDCAWIYLNEEGVGQGIQSGLSKAGISRSELWITSKLWNDCHRPEHVLPALTSSLHALGLEYLDLYLIHWPVAHKHGIIRPENGSQFESLEEVPLIETWQAILECQAKGLCKNVGVSNFSVNKLKQLATESEHVPAFNQVESHPYFQQHDLKNYCDQNNILLTAYSPLGSGDRPETMIRDNEPKLFADPTIGEIAESRNVSPAQVLLAWAIQRGTCVIPKSSTPSHLEQNFVAANVELSESEMNMIASLDRGFRYVDGTFWEHPDGPYTVKNLWDE